MAYTLKLYLEHAGYEPAVAGDGINGLEMACGKDVALVILDLMIPGISGHEVCKRLRQNSTVPIMMLTARGSEDDRVTGLELGRGRLCREALSPARSSCSRSGVTQARAATADCATTADSGGRTGNQLLGPQCPSARAVSVSHADRISFVRSAGQIPRARVHSRGIAGARIWA